MDDLFSVFSGVLWVFFAFYVFVKLIRSVRMVPTKSELIVERLGRYHATLGPGFHVLLPFIDRVAYNQDLKEESIEVPPQECFTRDNVKVEVDGIIYMSVINSKQASYGVTDYRFAAIQLAQTTTRSVVGTLDLDQTFEEREAINHRVVQALNEVGDAWGIQLHRYEVKNIVPPASVREAMERQMGAERERRTLLARADAERQSRINDSEGKKTEAINASQGEMQKRVNEAEGRAAEILAVAQATAESIEKMGSAIAQTGGKEAIKLKLSQFYLTKIASLARRETNVLLPADLTRFNELLANVGIDVEGAMNADGASPAPETVSYTVEPEHHAEVTKPQLPARDLTRDLTRGR